MSQKQQPDPEMLALRRVDLALSKLDTQAKARVIRFTAERVDEAYQRERAAKAEVDRARYEAEMNKYDSSLAKTSIGAATPPA